MLKVTTPKVELKGAKACTVYVPVGTGTALMASSPRITLTGFDRAPAVIEARQDAAETFRTTCMGTGGESVG